MKRGRYSKQQTLPNKNARLIQETTSSTPPLPEQSPKNLFALPFDVLYNVFYFLSLYELWVLSQVSGICRDMCYERIRIQHGLDMTEDLDFLVPLRGALITLLKVDYKTNYHRAIENIAGRVMNLKDPDMSDRTYRHRINSGAGFIFNFSLIPASTTHHRQLAKLLGYFQVIMHNPNLLARHLSRLVTELRSRPHTRRSHDRAECCLLLLCHMTTKHTPSVLTARRLYTQTFTVVTEHLHDSPFPHLRTANRRSIAFLDYDLYYLFHVYLPLAIYVARSEAQRLLYSRAQAYYETIVPLLQDTSERWVNEKRETIMQNRELMKQMALHWGNLGDFRDDWLKPFTIPPARSPTTATFLEFCTFVSEFVIEIRSLPQRTSPKWPSAEIKTEWERMWADSEW